ncbi:Rhodanese-like domain-containing protein [Obelidium mucronatum]|nr:Rhodanese-like domain-containing protein [Obelidium mucronatum]
MATTGNWWDAYPAPKATPERWTHEQVAELIRSNAVNGVDYAIVDVRRADFGGGTVKGALNVHAQTFYDELPEFVAKHKTVSKVFFFCNSSNGRGPRSAAWYQDRLDEQGITTSKGMVLAGGIKAWVASYKDDLDLTEGYDAAFWAK